MATKVLEFKTVDEEIEYYKQQQRAISEKRAAERENFGACTCMCVPVFCCWFLCCCCCCFAVAVAAAAAASSNTLQEVK